MSPRLGVILLVTTWFCWGFSYPATGIMLDTVDVWAGRSIVMAVSGVMLLALAYVQGHEIAVPRAHCRDLVIAAVFNMTIFQVAMTVGIHLFSAGRTAVIVYTMPLWAAPLSFLVLGESVTWRRLVALTLGTAGLVILIASDIEKLDQAPLGALFMLAGAISWACGTIAQKRVDWGVPTTVLVGWQYVIGGLPIYIAAGAFVDYETVSFPTLWPLLSVIYNILIAFVFCYYAYYEVVRIFPVGIATVGTLATPIVGVFSGALVLGEKLAWPEYSALTLVVAGLGLPILWRSSRSRLR